MKTTLIKIKKLIGIKELELNGASVEITGRTGSGKSSVLDAIRILLSNKASRKVIIRQGETEAELLLETDSGLLIERKKRLTQSDYTRIRDNGREVASPEAFLRDIFTPLQLDPVKFTEMTEDEQNKIILGLIEFDWDVNWIQQQFGEVPAGVDYSQHILKVLYDIQCEKGQYYQGRQNVNREILIKKTSAEDVAKAIPAGYQAEKWEAYDLNAQHKKLAEQLDYNGKIQRAKTFRESFQNKLRGLEATRDINISAEEKTVSVQREGLQISIERLRAEILAAEKQLCGLDAVLETKVKLIKSEHETAVAKLRADTQVADEWADKTPIVTDALRSEIDTAAMMQRHLNEFARMKSNMAEAERLQAISDEYTRKIELARSLPGEILQTATIPVKGLTVKDGTPLINGLPISNLSRGEQLDLCIDVTISKPGALQIILLDDVEKLSTENRKRLYEKCKAKGLQFVAARTTDDDTLEVTAL